MLNITCHTPDMWVSAVSWHEYFWFKYGLDRSTVYTKIRLTRVRAHDLQIIDGTFHVTEMFALTTEPSGTTSKEMHCHTILDVWGEHAWTLRYTDALAIDTFVVLLLVLCTWSWTSWSKMILLTLVIILYLLSQCHLWVSWVSSHDFCRWSVVGLVVQSLVLNHRFHIALPWPLSCRASLFGTATQRNHS